MGCFSFICQECGEGILSDSYSGENVKLFLLKNNKIIEQMEGEYDSYGRVFDKSIKKESIEWKMAWDAVCDLMFHPGSSNGIAAIHTKCFKKLPVTRSKDDPNQGSIKEV